MIKGFDSWKLSRDLCPFHWIGRILNTEFLCYWVLKFYDFSIHFHTCVSLKPGVWFWQRLWFNIINLISKRDLQTLTTPIHIAFMQLLALLLDDNADLLVSGYTMVTSPWAFSRHGNWKTVYLSQSVYGKVRSTNLMPEYHNCTDPNTLSYPTYYKG